MMHSDEQIKYWTDKYTELEKHAKALQVYLDAECSIRRVAEMKLETCRTALGEVFFSELDRLLCEHDRAILEAAADRHCVKTCKPEGYKDSDYHCRICPDRRVILSR